MSVALNALLPVLIVIVVGWAAANIPIIPREQWAGLDTLMYYILFPSLLVVSLTATDLTALPFATLGLALILSILTMAALCLLLRPLLASRFGVDGPGFTSIFQGATRWNTTVAIAIAGFLYGAEGVALMSVAIVAMIPLLNVLCVSVLSWFAAATTPSPKRIAIELAKNPLILACAPGHRAQPRRHRSARRRHVGAAAPRQRRARLRRARGRRRARPSFAAPSRHSPRARHAAAPAFDAAPRRRLLPRFSASAARRAASRSSPRPSRPRAPPMCSRERWAATRN